MDFPSSLELSDLEKLSLNLERAAVFNTYAAIELKSNLSQSILQKALGLLQQKHYYLNVCIKESRFLYQANQAIPILLNDITSREEAINLIREEMAKKFDLTKAPLLKILLFQEGNNVQYLAVVISHIISDGPSNFRLLNSLLEFCDTTREFNKLPAINFCEQYFPEVSGYKAKEILTATKVTYNKIDTDQKYTQSIKLSLSEEQTLILRKKCKEKQVTIYSALTAGGILAVYNKYLKNVGDIDHCNIMERLTLDMRQYCKGNIAKEQLGFWSLLQSNIRRVSRDENFWDLAVRIQTDLDNTVKNRWFVADMQKLKTTLKQYESGVPNFNSFDNSLVAIMNNFGNMDSVFSSDFKNFKIISLLDEAILLSANYTKTNYMLFCILTTFNKKMNLIFYYQPMSISKSDYNVLIKDFINILNENLLLNFH